MQTIKTLSTKPTNAVLATMPAQAMSRDTAGISHPQTPSLVPMPGIDSCHDVTVRDLVRSNPFA